MPQTHISALHTGAGAGALLTAVCGSVVIVRVCRGAVGIGAISLGRENVEKLPSSEDASYTQVDTPLYRGFNVYVLNCLQI